MRIPISWLKEYVDVRVSAKELSDKLTMSGTENEILHAEKGTFGGIVVGEIRGIKKHPNADKLQVTKTSIGKEVLQIVCGAPNIEVGQKVPVALVGAQIGEFEIKEAEIRGVKSYGMLASEAELGISDDHTGIMTLDPRAKIGEELEKALNIGDTVLEAEITPNRGDCLSMIGIAREVAAVTDKKVKLPSKKVKEVSRKTSDDLSIEIKDKDLCRRYIGRVIRNIKVGPSPKWMQDRLNASGVRPINNVVDVTNYVMLEMGQPLHAFDADKINGSRLVIRRAKRSEKIRTLDGIERDLDTNDLVIADTKNPQAIAGIMGGAESEISEGTSTVVLESANFNKTATRKSAQRLGLRTEGVTRWEKGLPLGLAEEASDRAAALLAEIANGEVSSGKIDVGERQDKQIKVALSFDKAQKLLGVAISPSKATSILEGLGFKVGGKGKEGAEFVVPPWRLDVSIEEDLLEEIARIYGYDKIPSTLPEGKMPNYEVNNKVAISAKIRDVLTALGFFEVYTYSFTTKDKTSMSGRERELVKIANPLSQDQEYMRTDLLGSVLDVVAKNKEDEMRIYEIAPVYQKGREDLKLGILVTSKSEDEAWLDAAGAMDLIFSRFNIRNKFYKNLAGENSGTVHSDNQKLGQFVIINSAQITQHKIKSKGICFIEIDVETLGRLELPTKFSAIPKFPASERDLTFTLEERVTVREIYETIDKIKSGIRARAEVIDIYRGKGLPEGEKSVSVRFTYQSFERTLTDKEVDDDQEKIIREVKKSLGGHIRGEGK